MRPNNQVEYTTEPVWLLRRSGGGSGAPGGPDTSIQINSGGSFEGFEEFTYDAATGTVIAPKLALKEDAEASSTEEARYGATSIRFRVPNGGPLAGRCAMFARPT